MSTSKIILIVLSMLLSGFAIGFFTAGRMASMRINKHRDMMHNIELEKEFISRKVGLSKSQEEVFFPVLDSMLVLQKTIREEHHAAMRSARKKMFDSIRPSLSPDQLKKLTRFTNKPRPPR
jgi:uncharacterized protein YneF (UPF0154 family)